MLGFRPDGARNSLHWDLRLNEPHGIRRLRFGKITADLLYDGKSMITVNSNAPFQLTVNTRSLGIRSLSIKPGVNQFANTWF